MTVIQVLGCGIEKGTREYEIDEYEEMELLPKQQINIVVENGQSTGDHRDCETGVIYRTYWRRQDLCLWN